MASAFYTKSQKFTKQVTADSILHLTYLVCLREGLQNSHFEIKKGKLKISQFLPSSPLLLEISIIFF